MAGESLRIKGEITANEDLRFEGEIEGTISVPEHTLVVGRTARSGRAGEPGGRGGDRRAGLDT